jgi:hypothetical protein
MDMNCKNKIAIFICIFTLPLFSSCTQDPAVVKYYDSAREFNEIYFDLADDLDTSNVIYVIKQLQSEEYIIIIDTLRDLLSTIAQYVPERKAILVKNMEERYNNLLLIKNSYELYEYMSKDEKHSIDLAVFQIKVDLSSWNDKSLSKVWE